MEGQKDGEKELLPDLFVTLTACAFLCASDRLTR